MTLTVHTDLVQGTDAWLAARRGIVTASVVGQLITSRPLGGIAFQCPECGAQPDAPCYSMAQRGKGEVRQIKTLHASRTDVAAESDAPPVLDVARNDTSRALTRTLVAERITGWTEDVYVSAAMMRGTLDEPIAREIYAEHYAPVDEVGFMVLERDGWRLGYSPDGLVGDNGLIEIKSREPKAQLATILADDIPAANIAQIQAGLRVSGREWCDYVSYCGGMPLYTKRVYPDPRWFAAIEAAVTEFEDAAAVMVAVYEHNTAGLPMTERVEHFPEVIF